MQAVKRKALGVGTNKDKQQDKDKEALKIVEPTKPLTRARTKSLAPLEEEAKEILAPVEPKVIGLKEKVVESEKMSIPAPSKLPVRQTRTSRARVSEEKESSTSTVQARRITRQSRASGSGSSQGSSTTADEDDANLSLYRTAVSTPESE